MINFRFYVFYCNQNLEVNNLCSTLFPSSWREPALEVPSHYTGHSPLRGTQVT